MVWRFLGLPELLILVVVVAPLTGIAAVWFVLRRRAKRFAYPSTAAYLRAAPRTDAEKRDAADLALKGLAWCLLGMLFGPLVLIGVIPLFYGGRKVVYASMGLGLVDDGDLPST